MKGGGRDKGRGWKGVRVEGLRGRRSRGTLGVKQEGLRGRRGRGTLGLRVEGFKGRRGRGTLGVSGREYSVWDQIALLCTGRVRFKSGSTTRQSAFHPNVYPLSLTAAYPGRQY